MSTNACAFKHTMVIVQVCRCMLTVSTSAPVSVVAQQDFAVPASPQVLQLLHVVLVAHQVDGVQQPVLGVLHHLRSADHSDD